MTDQPVDLQASATILCTKQHYIKPILEQFLGEGLCSGQLTMKWHGHVHSACSVMLLQHLMQCISPSKSPPNKITWLENLLNEYRQEINHFDPFALGFPPLNAALIP